MKDIINDIVRGWVLTWAAHSGNGGVPMSMGHAPAGSTPPTVTYAIVSESHYGTFGSDIADIRLQVDVRDSDGNMAGAMALAAELMDCYHRKDLVMPAGSGVRHVCTHAANGRTRYEEDTRTWLVSRDYIVTADEGVA